MPLITKSINRFKVNLTDNDGFIWRGRKINEMKTHHQWVWSFKNDHFELEVCIEVPIGQEFQIENSIVQIFLYIDPPIRRKKYFEMYNALLTTYHDENMKILLKLIEDFGEKVNKDFKEFK
jgi:hypothetical protein